MIIGGAFELRMHETVQKNAYLSIKIVDFKCVNEMRENMPKNAYFPLKIIDFAANLNWNYSDYSFNEMLENMQKK